MKFLKYKQTTGLEIYLQNILEVYKKSKLQTNNETQRKVLSTWLVELKLAKINEFKAANSQQAKQPDDDEEAFRMQQDQQKVTLHIMEQEFHKFLTENKDDLDQDTIL